MSVLMVKFDGVIDISCFKEFAARLEGFTILGDWHEHRLKTVSDLNMSDECAPARSIRDAREKHGPALHVQLQLQDGVQLDGGLGRTGVLIGNKKTTTNAIKGDPGVQSFLNGLKQFCKIRSVEIL